MKKVAGFHSFDFGFFWLFSFDLLSGFGIMDFQKDTSTTGIELEKRTPRWMDRSDANRAMEIRRPAGSKSSLERACKLILSGRKGRREIEGGGGTRGQKGGNHRSQCWTKLPVRNNVQSVSRIRHIEIVLK